MYAPSLDPAGFAFISDNTITKIQIARVYAKKELNGFIGTTFAGDKFSIASAKSQRSRNRRRRSQMKVERMV
jgi:hypothetical protein